MRAALLDANPAIVARPISAEEVAEAEAGFISNALQGARSIRSLAGRTLAEDVSASLQL
jgi:branched-subunit amino acid aminotransferase/4-amino-4-deoxychorismate lyase